MPTVASAIGPGQLWLPPSVNRASRQADGLALWLPSGQPIAAGDRNRLTTIGAFATIVPDQMHGRVWNFDGQVNSYLNWNPVAFDGMAFNAARGHSVTAWVKPMLINATLQYAVNWTSGGLTIICFAVTAANALVVASDLVFGGTIWGTYAATAVANTWYHLGYTYKFVGGTGTHTAYLNGRSLGPNTTAQHTGVIAQFDLGRRNDVGGQGNNFTGQVGDTRFYTRALSDPEMFALWDPATRAELHAPRRIRYAPPEPAVTLQLARALSTVSAGTWTTEAGGTSNLELSIDEAAPANDADFIRSELSGASDTEVRLRLDPLGTPPVHTSHVVRYRYAKSAAGGSTIGLRVTLYAADGTTEITHQDHAAITETVTDGALALSTGQAAAIPDADYATGLVVGFLRI